jgi:hypothetical protein
MAGENCFNCVYAQWDLTQVVMSFNNAFPTRPTCANHPDSLGRPRPTPLREICRNFRPRPADPAKGAKQIPLGDGVFAYVDAADYEWLSQFNWRFQNGYAARRDKTRTTYMHRELAKPPRGMTVDHANHNKLDNTRENLRVCTQQQNSHNNRKHMGSSSRFKGVGYNREKEKWFAKAYIEGERIWLGYHEEEVAAAKAYDAKAVELFGEFAYLNFPEDWPPERRKELHEKWLKERETKKAEDGEQRTAGRKRKTHNAGRKTKQEEKSRAGTRGRRASNAAAQRAKGIGEDRAAASQ